MRATKSTFENRQSGTAAIEFAIGALILVPLLIGTTELGIAMYQAMAVYNAVDAGALYAMNPTSTVTPTSCDTVPITNRVVSASSVTGLTATPAPTCFYGCPGAGGITTTGQVATCADGNAAGQYVQVNASLPHTTILANTFGLPDTFTATSVVRVQ
jgi:Flp pilus assembly protein TadG